MNVSSIDDDIDTWIVSRLGDPWKFLFVDFDVAMLSGLVMLVFFTAGLQLLGAAVGGGLGYWMHRSRQNKPRGYLLHLGYWLLPHALSLLKRTPPSYCMEMLG